MPTEEEMLTFIKKFTPSFMVWGSDDVLAAWSRFRRLSITAMSKDPAESLWAFEDLILAIRKDLGHSNRGLTRGVVLGLFVNDIDSILHGQNPSSQPVLKAEVEKQGRPPVEPKRESMGQ